MAVKLSEKIVKEAGAPTTGYSIVWDSEIGGFGLRIMAPTAKHPAGIRAFVLNYKVGGRERRKTIGKYPAWSVVAAREKAKELRQRVDSGEDPIAEEEKERGEPTVAELADRYLEEWATKRKRASGAQRDAAMIRADIVPQLGRLKVKAVTYSEIYELHRKISKRAPIRANRVLSCVAKMFALAVAPWGMRADNPCKGIERNQENQRERFLSPAEIAQIVAALQAYPQPRRMLPHETDAEEQATALQGRNAANATLFLLLTGARSGEAMGATWGQFDLTTGDWSKPSSHTKQNKFHHVPLNGPARQLLAQIRPKDAKPTDFVFAGRKRGEPLKQLRSCWSSVTKAAGITGVRVHDLRHSYASMLASSGSSLAVIGRMLGHSSPRTTARYAHFFTDPLREAAERVGSIVLPEGKSAEVLPLKGKWVK